MLSIGCHYLPNTFLTGVGDEPSGLQNKTGTNHFLPSTIALNFTSLRNGGWGDWQGEPNPNLVILQLKAQGPSSSSLEQARASHKRIRAVLLAFLPGTPSTNVNLT